APDRDGASLSRARDLPLRRPVSSGLRRGRQADHRPGGDSRRRDHRSARRSVLCLAAPAASARGQHPGLNCSPLGVDDMRITKVYTKQGDQGYTRLGDGSKVPKDHPRVVAYGEVDLANSTVGVVRAELRDPELDAVLEDVQHRLFDLGGVLCVPGTDESAFTLMLGDRIARLERLM